MSTLRAKNEERRQWLWAQLGDGRPVLRCCDCGFDEIADVGGCHQEEDGRFWCHECWADESFRRDVAQVSGKTIATVRRWRANDNGWNERSYLTFEFTDGMTMEVHGWGYDAWGCDDFELSAPAVSEPVT